MPCFRCVSCCRELKLVSISTTTGLLLPYVYCSGDEALCFTWRWSILRVGKDIWGRNNRRWSQIVTKVGIWTNQVFFLKSMVKTKFQKSMLAKISLKKFSPSSLARCYLGNEIDLSRTHLKLYYCCSFERLRPLEGGVTIKANIGVSVYSFTKCLWSNKLMPNISILLLFLLKFRNFCNGNQPRACAFWAEEQKGQVSSRTRLPGNPWRGRGSRSALFPAAAGEAHAYLRHRGGASRRRGRICGLRWALVPSVPAPKPPAQAEGHRLLSVGVGAPCLPARAPHPWARSPSLALLSPCWQRHSCRHSCEVVFRSRRAGGGVSRRQSPGPGIRLGALWPPRAVSCVDPVR